MEKTYFVDDTDGHPVRLQDALSDLSPFFATQFAQEQQQKTHTTDRAETQRILTTMFGGNTTMRHFAVAARWQAQTHEPPEVVDEKIREAIDEYHLLYPGDGDTLELVKGA